IEGQTDRLALTLRSMREVVSRCDEVLRCDSAILDINLGFDEPSGVEVYRWLRAQGFSRPIRFLTGHASRIPEVAEALRLGDVKLYSKPIDIPLFLKIIRCEEP